MATELDPKLKGNSHTKSISGKGTRKYKDPEMIITLSAHGTIQYIVLYTVIQGKSDMEQVMKGQAGAESCRVLWGLVRNLVESH